MSESPVSLWLMLQAQGIVFDSALAGLVADDESTLKDETLNSSTPTTYTISKTSKRRSNILLFGNRLNTLARCNQPEPTPSMPSLSWYVTHIEWCRRVLSRRRDV
jgi:hypothetical protein